MNLGSVSLDHQAGRVNIRNRTQFGDYDRFYQNFVPGVVSADKSLVSLSTYNNATARFNVFNQTDVSGTVFTGKIRHTLLGGVEVGRQLTDNFRNTGFFNNTATTLQVPYANPTIFTPVTFRQSLTDADNHLETNLGATAFGPDASLATCKWTSASATSVSVPQQPMATSAASTIWCLPALALSLSR